MTVFTFSDLFLKGVIDSVLYFEKTDRLKNRMAELRERRQKLVNEDEEEKCLEKLRALKRIVEKKPFLTAIRFCQDQIYLSFLRFVLRY